MPSALLEEITQETTGNLSDVVSRRRSTDVRHNRLRYRHCLAGPGLCRCQGGDDQETKGGCANCCGATNRHLGDSPLAVHGTVLNIDTLILFQYRSRGQVVS